MQLKNAFFVYKELKSFESYPLEWDNALAKVCLWYIYFYPRQITEINFKTT